MQLNLDVRETQFPAMTLYEAEGYARWGVSPRYAQTADGRYHRGFFYAKCLDGAMTGRQGTRCYLGGRAGSGTADADEDKGTWGGGAAGATMFAAGAAAGALVAAAVLLWCPIVAAPRAS